MKVAEYFKRFSFEELRPELEKLYVANEDRGFYTLSNEQWEAIYQEFSCLAGVSTPYHIQVNDRWEKCHPMIDMNCTIHDEDFNWIGSLAMYGNIKEIMQMKVFVHIDIDITDKELAAGLFWEITYVATEEKEQLIKKAFMNSLVKNETEIITSRI